MSDTKKIGTFLLFLGIFFLLIGMILLMDRKLLAMGNILFLIGFSILSGVASTLKFFGCAPGNFKDRWKKKWRGLATFEGGIVLVLLGYSKTGIFLELFGFISLFGSLFPIALAFLRKLPVVGKCLDLPGVSRIADKIAGKTMESMV
jgi:lysylphosphatidylglycerol synthetase-like protein (DUF2156 family)